METMQLNNIFDSEWYKGDIPGCVTKGELENIFGKLAEAGLSDRRLTIMPTQGVVLNNIAIMLDVDNPDEYIIMWPSIDI